MAAGPNAIEPPAPRLPPLQADNALQALEQQIRRTATLLENPRRDGVVFVSGVERVAGELIALADRHPDGLVASLLLVPFGDYAPAHSVHVAALCAKLAPRLALSTEERHCLVCAALTMNVAMVSLQNMLHHQEHALSDAQHQLMREHPLLGVTLLREAGVTDLRWLAIVASHHEELDGSGYPQGLQGDVIDPLAHILHLADITCAKLMPRSYRPALVPSVALGQLFRNEDHHYEQRVTTAIIKELGVYPPGSFVRLMSGEIAVVVKTLTRATTPDVITVRDADGQPSRSPQHRDTTQPSYLIEQAVSPHAANLRPGALARLWPV
ncbi:HD domain-containing phosphohydrolase [Crenobacter sp. SG2305]|uniref:HD-GYP domain-containing protein n=1 Tax=Crenobacter oryzisoli TaxID=3056844 RepID=UPI0025AB5787|nr:HD domain-containing phosphohydrolase [Crenobacter sp. SG2305]MDN0085001.1 HD domain-containing phosphohydrolase [Crenobacter sp. SG2305]